MPTYTYRCTECDHHFDVFHSMSENGTRTCPDCGAEAQKMIGTGAGLIFKGSGFYITDYKGKNPSTNGNGHNGHSHNGNGHHSESSSSSTTESSAPAKETKSSEKKPAADSSK